VKPLALVLLAAFLVSACAPASFSWQEERSRGSATTFDPGAPAPAEDPLASIPPGEEPVVTKPVIGIPYPPVGENSPPPEEECRVKALPDAAPLVSITKCKGERAALEWRNR
jgi:hypothetical protein